MKKTLLLLLFILACVTGCVMPKGESKEIYNYLVPTRDDFKDRYGDTLQTRLIYNIALLKNNDLVIAGTINKLHPKATTQPSTSPGKNDIKFNKETGKYELYDGTKWTVPMAK